MAPSLGHRAGATGLGRRASAQLPPLRRLGTKEVLGFHRLSRFSIGFPRILGFPRLLFYFDLDLDLVLDLILIWLDLAWIWLGFDLILVGFGLDLLWILVHYSLHSSHSSHRRS